MDDSLTPERIKGALSGDSVDAIEVVVNELYAVMGQDIPFQDKARQALEIGRIYLGADNGHLTRIDQETDHWEALVSTDPPDGQFPPGLEVDLTTTYCRRVLDSSSQIALNDAPEQGWADDPAYAAHGLHCYVGTPLRVNGEQYGTVCFVATEPRETPYSDGEKILAELISHMLERELERDQLETQLTRQKNLSLVLNRVLRHNMRNEMAIIRGYTQMMADELPNSNFGQVALRSIDKVISLSEKARELDEIIANDEDRNSANIHAIVSEVVSGVRSAYPSASISIEGDEEVTGTVLPSFRRAMRELIENAAKHGGDQPTVEVTVESVPNAVEIQIVDDGSGLDNQEIEVLRSGSETPLMHGSGLGLWLTHWIVTQHDGEIETSVTDAGTTLTVRVSRTPVAGGKQRIRELVRARDQYRAAFEEAADGMTITDDQARILEVNQAAARIFGMDRQELLGRSMNKFIPADLDFEAEWDAILASDRKRDELRIIRDDGSVCNIEYTAKTDIVPGQHLIVSRDVTDRIAREQTLQETKRRLGSIIDLSPEPILAVDSAGKIVLWNEAAEDAFGYAAERAHGETLQSLVVDTGQEATRFEERFQRVLSGETIRGIDVQRKRDDGEMVNLRVSATPLRDSSNSVTGMIAVAQNITELKERERDLERFKEAVETAGHAIIFTDTDGTIEYVNPAFERITGYCHDTAVGNTPNILNAGVLRADYFQELWKTIQAGNIWEEIIVNQRKSGERYTAIQTIAPIADQTGELTGYVAVQSNIMDLNERVC